MPWHAALERQLNLTLQEGFPLASLTTWEAGGTAEFLLAPRNTDQARGAFAFCRTAGVPVWTIGGGSNVLVHPQGLEGMTLWMAEMKGFSLVRGPEGSFLIEADAGCPTRRLLNFCLSNGFSGLEFATGIHGSIGGALVCNAGAGPEAMGSVVEWVESIEADGTTMRWKGTEIHSGYRYSSLASEPRLVTRCGLRVAEMDKAIVRNRVLDFWSRRKGQPHGAKTAGCVFKNPGFGNEPAGLLLDRCGCKGMAIGDAVVSRLHANFIENRGKATAGQIWELIRLCRKKVFDASGVWLELEVTLLGGPWD